MNLGCLGASNDLTEMNADEVLAQDRTSDAILAASINRITIQFFAGTTNRLPSWRLPLTLAKPFA
jgi:hypothetical protein